MSKNFADLGLSKSILEAVKSMGYEIPTPIQEQTIPMVLDHKDVVGAAQTGTGKTAAFMLPIMDLLERDLDERYAEWKQVQKEKDQAYREAHPDQKKRRRRGKYKKPRGPFALIVTPTRELAQQIDDVAKEVEPFSKVHPFTVVGGQKYGPQIDGIKKGVDVLVATPGRLIDLMEQNAVELDNVKYLVLDEADRMLDMGFWPSVRKIVAAVPEERHTLLFSATLSRDIMNQTHSLLKDPEFVEIAKNGETSDQVDQFIMPVAQSQKSDLLQALLEEKGGTRILVFTRTKRRADACAKRLKKANIKAESIHADKTQAQRTRALDNFKNSKIDVLIATDVLARGIDVSDVNYVVNYDVPMNPEDYVHRIGRTGRAGEHGSAYTFVGVDEITAMREIEYFTKHVIDVHDVKGFEYQDSRVVPRPDRSAEKGKTAAGKRKLAYNGSRRRRSYPGHGARRR